MHFPDGGMYLLYWNLHRFPWLFRWSVSDVGVPPSRAAAVDQFGRLHALSPGVVQVYGRPRLGNGLATARFVITPRGVDAAAPMRPDHGNKCSQTDTLVFRCRLGSPLGDVLIELRRDEDRKRLATLIIMSLDDSVIQSMTLPHDMETPSQHDDVVRAFDVDADRHPDLVIHTGTDADSEPIYRLWRFDGARNEFTPDLAFGARLGVSPVYGRPCVQMFVRRQIGIETPLLCLKDGRWAEATVSPRE